MIGIILAGGLSSRMGGGDKAMRAIGGRPILARIVATLAPQCAGIVINANGDPARFAPFGQPLVSDDMTGHLGPLAGVLAGLDWVAAQDPQQRFVVTVPSDTPFLPGDLVSRLETVRAEQGASIVCARSADSTHYVAALWAVDLRHALRAALDQGEVRQVRRFIRAHPNAEAEWSIEPYDPFFNVNTPADMEKAEQIARLFDRPSV